jgi:hypothetical protein
MKTEAWKTPYFLHGESDVIAMAGLYELWPNPGLPKMIRTSGYGLVQS